MKLASRALGRLAVLVFFASLTQPGRAIVAIDNTNNLTQSPGQGWLVASDFWSGSQFKTGSNQGGYSISSFSASGYIISGDPEIRLALYAVGAGGQPSTSLADALMPFQAIYPPGYTTISGSQLGALRDVVLQPLTEYALVMTGDQPFQQGFAGWLQYPLIDGQIATYCGNDYSFQGGFSYVDTIGSFNQGSSWRSGCALPGGDVLYSLEVNENPASTSSVPGPLTVMGAVVAFRSSRQLRNRIKERSASSCGATPELR